METSELNEKQKKLQEIIEGKIRPSLQMHGGDMEIADYDGKTLKIKYHGACGCCPGAMMSTLPMIEDVLKKEFDPDIKVEMA